MTYIQRLNPWCIIRPFPNMCSKIVGRFRRRIDAEGHLRVLKQMMPTVSFEIMFDVPPEEADAEDLQQNPELIPPTPLKKGGYKTKFPGEN